MYRLKINATQDREPVAIVENGERKLQFQVKTSIDKLTLVDPNGFEGSVTLNKELFFYKALHDQYEFVNGRYVGNAGTSAALPPLGETYYLRDSVTDSLYINEDANPILQLNSNASLKDSIYINLIKTSGSGLSATGKYLDTQGTSQDIATLTVTESAVGGDTILTVKSNESSPFVDLEFKIPGASPTDFNYDIGIFREQGFHAWGDLYEDTNELNPGNVVHNGGVPEVIVVGSPINNPYPLVVTIEKVAPDSISYTIVDQTIIPYEVVEQGVITYPLINPVSLANGITLLQVLPEIPGTSNLFSIDYVLSGVSTPIAYKPSPPAPAKSIDPTLEITGIGVMANTFEGITSEYRIEMEFNTITPGDTAVSINSLTVYKINLSTGAFNAQLIPEVTNIAVGGTVNLHDLNSATYPDITISIFSLPENASNKTINWVIQQSEAQLYNNLAGEHYIRFADITDFQGEATSAFTLSNFYSAIRIVENVSSMGEGSVIAYEYDTQNGTWHLFNGTLGEGDTKFFRIGTQLKSFDDMAVANAWAVSTQNIINIFAKQYSTLLATGFSTHEGNYNGMVEHLEFPK